MMNNSHSQLVYESLLLGIELLRGGNSAVQADMYRIIMGPEQHGFGFLDAIRKRIAWSVTDIREAKRFIKQFVYVSQASYCLGFDSFVFRVRCSSSFMCFVVLLSV